MAKMFAKSQIIMPDGSVVARKSVFEATPAQAKQFDALDAARPATSDEIAAAARAKALADGEPYEESDKGK
jgi:hypothetical protein